MKTVICAEIYILLIVINVALFMKTVLLRRNLLSAYRYKRDPFHEKGAWAQKFT